MGGIMSREPGAVEKCAAGALWTSALLLLAGVLVWSAWDTRGEVAGLELRRNALQREVERAQRENQALRDEIRALEEDPVYVESLLRRQRRAGPGERILPPLGGR